MSGTEKNQNLIKIGERLQEVRGTMSKAEFSGALGIHSNSLANYESGKRALDVIVVSRLIERFKVDAGWLITGHATDDGDCQTAIAQIRKIVNAVR